MRVVDENGIGIAHIQATFDNGGRNQNVKASGHKVEHQFFQFFAVHLPVSYTNFGVGNKALDHPGHFLDIFDPVVDKEDLTSPLNLVRDPIADDLFLQANHPTVNGEAVRWRGVDDR